MAMAGRPARSNCCRTSSQRSATGDGTLRRRLDQRSIHLGHAGDHAGVAQFGQSLCEVEPCLNQNWPNLTQNAAWAGAYMHAIVTSTADRRVTKDIEFYTLATTASTCCPARCASTRATPRNRQRCLRESRQVDGIDCLQQLRPARRFRCSGERVVLLHLPAPPTPLRGLDRKPAARLPCGHRAIQAPASPVNLGWKPRPPATRPANTIWVTSHRGYTVYQNVDFGSS